MYQRAIAERTDENPRHVEAYMRLQNRTLDHLCKADFNAEVDISAKCVRAAGPAESEALAASFGL